MEMHERFTVDGNPREYHRAMQGLLTCAFELRKTKGYAHMRDTLRDGQLRYIFDMIEEESLLTADNKEKCIINTLIDMHNESAKVLDREILPKERY